MSSAGLELRVSRLLGHARLAESAIYDHGPWQAVVYGCCSHRIALRKTIAGDEHRVVFCGYLSCPCSGIRLAEIFCRERLVLVTNVAGLPAAPCRIVLSVTVGEPELAA
jgi:hypothetical protein